MERSGAMALTLLLALLLAPAWAPPGALARAVPPGKPHIHTIAAEADRVESLPGWGPLDFGLYAGYITVDQAADRNLFYIYAESTVSPETAPLLLWLNGGPGCSSIGGGFLSELGPFYPVPGNPTRLELNPYAWNKFANVLFVESPAFVGFSYSRRDEDRIVGDARSAQDMHAFLLAFIKRYPALAERDLYISGESYAGHYLPTLAWEIVKGNREAAATTTAPEPHPPRGHLNFKGLLVGNAWTDTATDNLGAVDYWWSHGLISDTSALGIKANCNFSHIGPLDEQPQDSNPHTRAGACNRFCQRAGHELGPINIYHIYADVCLSPTQQRSTHALVATLGQAPHHPATSMPLLGAAAADSARQAAKRKEGGAQPDASLLHSGGGGARGRRGPQVHDRVAIRVGRSDPDDQGDPPPYDPCVDDGVEAYLNTPEVQKALHANVSGDLPGPWLDCSYNIWYSREDLLTSMLPVWRNLLDVEGLRYLVYSGDVDGIVPVVGTRRWVAGLGLPEAAPWRPWISAAQGQVGGWVVEYELAWQRGGDPYRSSRDAATTGEGDAPRQAAGGFVFATVRGAGHMVPFTQPLRAFHLASRFLLNQAL